eukprot:Hpha_TRINITY_DN11951_c0_g1::TRINITY_DN11951_c0_g1_i2::g.20614::m.20614
MHDGSMPPSPARGARSRASPQLPEVVPLLMQSIGGTEDMGVGTALRTEDVGVGCEHRTPEALISEGVKEATEEGRKMLQSDLGTSLEQISALLSQATQAATLAATQAEERGKVAHRQWEEERKEQSTRSAAGTQSLRELLSHQLSIERDREQRLTERERELATRERELLQRREDLHRRKQGLVTRRRERESLACARTERILAVCAASIKTLRERRERPPVSEIEEAVVEPILRAHSELAELKGEANTLRRAVRKWTESKELPTAPGPPLTDASFLPVVQLLKRAGAERYERNFREHCVDGMTLRFLTQEDLLRVGVLEVGTRRRLLSEISLLSAGGVLELAG